MICTIIILFLLATRLGAHIALDGREKSGEYCGVAMFFVTITELALF